MIGIFPGSGALSTIIRRTSSLGWDRLMGENFEVEMITPCGMNCGICVGYFGYTMKGEKRKHPCLGCRPRDKKCAFIKRDCERLAKNLIEYCYECPNYPCENLETLDQRYREKYGIRLIERLNYIQSKGIKNFLEEEQERWDCPNCGGAICVHTKMCYNCNYNLD
jgi:hypothetical protein